MLRFSVLGFPTRVEPGFWMLAVFLAFDRLRGNHKYLILVWVLAVFLSVLVHELGHAFAMRRHGMQPEISLHMMGGLTSAKRNPRLTRPQQIFVSFAGPLAGFVFAAIVYGVMRAAPQLTVMSPSASPMQNSIALGLDDLLMINLFWGVINLLPVLPLDGGHILQAALGPKRQRLTATLSLVFGGVVVLLGLYTKNYFMAFIFGMSAYQSYVFFRNTAPSMPSRPSPRDSPNKRADNGKRHLQAVPRAAKEELPAEVEVKLKKARAWLNEERFDEAGSLAEEVLASNPPVLARVDALHLIGWAHLLEGRSDQARRVLTAISRENIEPDAGLASAILLAVGELDAARAAAETARARGDDRKEVVSTLIQVLVAQKQVPRAAAVALDIVESLSDEDIGQMAQLVGEEGGHAWASRLNEALFERTSRADIGYDAARGRALEGDSHGAMKLLTRAVEAGFGDATRVWSDSALEALRNGELRAELEALLPQPHTD